jgi:hypothetical protein
MKKILIFFCVIFAFLAIENKCSSKNENDKDKDKSLKNVRYSGNTASFTYEIENKTLFAQENHEALMLKTIYYIINDGKADKIKITMYDYCKDSYGHTNKRTWHTTIDKSWSYWNEASKYATALDFGYEYGKYYLLSSHTEEGRFLCCGRDRSCN